MQFLWKLLPHKLRSDKVRFQYRLARYISVHTENNDDKQDVMSGFGFDDARLGYRCKTNWEVFRSWMILSFCKHPSLVDHSEKVCAPGLPVPSFGNHAFWTYMPDKGGPAWSVNWSRNLTDPKNWNCRLSEGGRNANEISPRSSEQKPQRVPWLTSDAYSLRMLYITKRNDFWRVYRMVIRSFSLTKDFSVVTLWSKVNCISRPRNLHTDYTLSLWVRGYLQFFLAVYPTWPESYGSEALQQIYETDLLWTVCCWRKRGRDPTACRTDAEVWCQRYLKLRSGGRWARRTAETLWNNVSETHSRLIMNIFLDVIFRRQ